MVAFCLYATNYCISIIYDKFFIKGKLYEDTANETDASLKNAGDEYSQARSNLDSWLDQRLGEVDASDFAAREGVFEEYYRAVDALQQKNTSEDKSVATYHSQSLTTRISEIN